MILDESSASAVALGMALFEDIKLRRLLVVDFGGGTLDLTIVQVENNIFSVKAIDGDDHLGGQDVDNALIKHIIELYEEYVGEKMTKEWIKRNLSNLRQVSCDIKESLRD